MFRSVDSIKWKTQDQPWEVTASDASYLLYVIDILEEDVEKLQEKYDNLVQSSYEHSQAMFGNMITSMLSHALVPRQAGEVTPISQETPHA